MNKRQIKKHNIKRRSMLKIRVKVQKTNHPVTVTNNISISQLLMYYHYWLMGHPNLKPLVCFRKNRCKYIKSVPKINHCPYIRKV